MEEESRALELLSELDSPLDGIGVANQAELALAERKRWKTPAVEEKVEELVLGFAAKSLDKGEDSNVTKRLLNLLPKTQPQDPLLARDSNRFLNTVRRPRTIHIGMREGVLEAARIIDIPLKAAWNSLSSWGKERASLAGYHEGHVAIAQIQDGRCQATPYRIPSYPNAPVCTHHIALSEGHSVSARVFQFPSSRKAHFQSLATLSAKADLLGSKENILGVGHDQDRGFLTLGYTQTSSLTVERYDFTGILRTSDTLDLVPSDIADLKWLLGARGDHLVVAANHFITWQESGGEFQTTELQSEIRSLEIAPAHRPLEALITTETEVLLSIPSRKRNRPNETINLHTSRGLRPIAGYTSDGHIIIIEGREGFVFHPTNYASPSATLKFPNKLANPKAVAAYGTGGFLVLAGQQLALFE